MGNRTLEIIDGVISIMSELDARESTSNILVREYQSIGWNELCDNAIKLIQELKTI